MLDFNGDRQHGAEWCRVVQSGAVWCRVVQKFLLRSEFFFVAHLLLKKFEQQMSNKNVKKSNLRHQISLITKSDI
jgi:hypothetical protein